MTTGRTAFRRVQISSPEVTPGTAVAATEILHCMSNSAYSDLSIYYPEEDRNSLSRNHGDDLITSYVTEIELEGDVNHRQAIWMFSNSIRGNVTPTQADATNKPNQYTWNFAPSLTTTANTPDQTNGVDTFTIEFGDNIQDYEAEYMVTESLELSGSPDDVVKFSWTAFARQLTESTLTPALTSQVVQRFATNKVKFYVDSSYANIGNTQKTDLLREWTWTFETGFTKRQTADGNLYFTSVNEAIKMLDLELKLKRGDGSEALKDSYEALSTVYLRIELTGNTELDAGQTNPPTILLDGAFKITEWDAPEDEDGTQYETLTLQSVYDTTGAMEYEVTVNTDLSAFA